jgi:hypothetical protein
MWLKKPLAILDRGQMSPRTSWDWAEKRKIIN